MSNPTKTLRQQFGEMLFELLNEKTFNYSAAKIARESGISLHKITAVRHDRPVNIDRDDLEAMRSYYEEKHLPPELNATDGELKELRARVRALEEEIEKLTSEKEKDGVS